MIFIKKIIEFFIFVFLSDLIVFTLNNSLQVDQNKNRF
jgi:hypothetical protein